MSGSKPDSADGLPACDKSVRPGIGSSAFQDFPIDHAPAWIAVCVDETVPVASAAWHGLVSARALAH